MISGLSACLLITVVNFFFFSTALWKPITRETKDRADNKGYEASSKKIISTGEYDFDMEKLGNNKTVGFAIIGYGALLSIIFIFVAMVRAIGNSSF